MAKKKELFIPEQEFNKELKVHKLTGMKLLLGYLYVLLFFYVIFILFGLSSLHLYAKVNINTAFVIINLIMFLTLILLTIGFTKDLEWVYPLGITWFSASIIYSFISIFFIKSNIFPVINEMMVLSFISTLLLNGLIIWYMVAMKHYFKKKHERHLMKLKTEERLFINIFFTICIITVLILATITINFFKSITRTADKIVSELRGKQETEMFALCKTKEADEKDICYVVLGSLLGGTEELCKNISSDFYKFTCLRMG